MGRREMMTNRKRMFILEYPKDFNATRAAKVSGYSEKTAYSSGQRLLKDVEVKAAIEAKIMGRDEVLIGLTEIARGDMADLMDITTQGFTLQLLSEDGTVNPKTKLIKKIKQKVTTIIAKKESDEDREIVETEIELYSAHEEIGRAHV
jgi:phage terminase small subunit